MAKYQEVIGLLITSGYGALFNQHVADVACARLREFNDAHPDRKVGEALAYLMPARLNGAVDAEAAPVAMQLLGGVDTDALPEGAAIVFEEIRGDIAYLSEQANVMEQSNRHDADLMMKLLQEHAGRYSGENR